MTIKSNHTHQQWYVWRCQTLILVHTQLGNELQNFLMLIGNRKVVVKLDVDFFHVFSEIETEQRINQNGFFFLIEFIIIIIIAISA
jgi:hypothetical protein